MVVVYGTVCRDRFHRVERFPGPGEYVDILAESDSIGGEAVNTALALHRWGTETVLCGNSPGTSSLRSLVEATGLSTRHLPDDDHFEPVCDIYVTPDGQRTMFGRGFLEMETWGRPELAPMSAGEWFTTDANHGSTATRAIDLALRAGMLVYVEDLVVQETLRGHVWQSSTDWFGQRGDIESNVEWLEGFTHLKGGFAILSDGANGFIAGGKWPSGTCRPVKHYPPFPCPDVVDSTGAGDVFRAGMLLGLSEGRAISETLRFASAAGSLNCRELGANAAIPSRDEVQGLIDAHPEIAGHYE